MFEKQTIEVSVGDTLLFEANWRDKQFRATNGELVTVASVESGAIELTDGRRLPSNYRQFTHCYAVTAHRSQGKTVDFEVLAAERMAQDLFYVSATRAREGLTIITSDSLSLQESIGVSGDRQSASELAERATANSSARAFAHDDLFRLYHVQQAPRPPSIPQQEIHQHHVHHHPPGLGIGYRTRLEARLKNLPQEMAEGVEADTMAKTLSESLRQQVAATGLQDAATLLDASTRDIKALSGQVSGTLKPLLSEYQSISATLSTDLAKLTCSFETTGASERPPSVRGAFERVVLAVSRSGRVVLGRWHLRHFAREAPDYQQSRECLCSDRTPRESTDSRGGAAREQGREETARYYRS